LQLSP
jgi:hypothetical protein